MRIFQRSGLLFKNLPQIFGIYGGYSGNRPAVVAKRGAPLFLFMVLLVVFGGFKTEHR